MRQSITPLKHRSIHSKKGRFARRKKSPRGSARRFFSTLKKRKICAEKKSPRGRADPRKSEVISAPQSRMLLRQIAAAAHFFIAAAPQRAAAIFCGAAEPQIFSRFPEFCRREPQIFQNFLDFAAESRRFLKSFLDFAAESL